MKKRNLRMFIGTLLVAGMVLTGCGSASSSTEPESAETEAAAEAVVDEAASDVAEEAEVVPEVEAEVADPVDVRVVAMSGPTAMGMIQFMNEADSGNLSDNKYSFTIASAVDEVPPMVAKGEVDIAAVPANLASVLYNNTEGAVQVMAVNTLGVLYIVDQSGDVASVEDLKGKTLYASGKGATPEYALNYILSGNGIDPEQDLTIEWKSEHTECLTALLADEDAIAMLPQPFVTVAQTKSEGINVALDLNAEWDKLQENADEASSMITGVVIVRKEFAENNPAAVEAFLAHYEESVSFVNSNVDEAATLVGQYEIVPEGVAKKAIPACNITYIAGDEMKAALSGYLNVLFESNPKAVGGTLPADDFYYGVN